MRLCVLLSRLTGWDRTQVLGLCVEEAGQWLEVAVAVKKGLRA